MKKLFRKSLITVATCGAGVIAFSSALEILAGECAAPGPNCMAPNCALPYAQQQGVQQVAPGMYAQPPATGEFEGESTGYGIRGMGFSLPAIHFEGASIRLPRMFSSKSPARMRIDAQTAPYVQGMPAQFGMLPAGQLGVQQSAPVYQQSAPAFQQSTPETCIPPCPATTQSEQRLRAELAMKDAEIRQMQDRFNRLEQAINRLAETPPQNVPTSTTRRAPAPQIVEAGYTQEQYDEEASADTDLPRPLVMTRATRPAQAQPAAAPRPCAPVKSSTAARPAEQPTPPNVGFSYIPEEEPAADDGLGVWKGEAKRPATRPARKWFSR